MKFQILFSPQHKHFINVEIVGSLEELAQKWHHEQSARNCQPEPMGEDTGAFCVFDHESETEDLGVIYFWNTVRRVIAHECVHAALSFLDCKVMVSKAVEVMSQDDQYEYYQEALAIIVEELFGQIEERLYPQRPYAEIKIWE